MVLIMRGLVAPLSIAGNCPGSHDGPVDRSVRYRTACSQKTSRCICWPRSFSPPAHTWIPHSPTYSGFRSTAWSSLLPSPPPRWASGRCWLTLRPPCGAPWDGRLIRFFLIHGLGMATVFHRAGRSPSAWVAYFVVCVFASLVLDRLCHQLRFPLAGGYSSARKTSNGG